MKIKTVANDNRYFISKDAHLMRKFIDYALTLGYTLFENEYPSTNTIHGGKYHLALYVGTPSGRLVRWVMGRTSEVVTYDLDEDYTKAVEFIESLVITPEKPVEQKPNNKLRHVFLGSKHLLNALHEEALAMGYTKAERSYTDLTPGFATQLGFGGNIKGKLIYNARSAGEEKIYNLPTDYDNAVAVLKELIGTESKTSKPEVVELTKGTARKTGTSVIIEGYTFNLEGLISRAEDYLKEKTSFSGATVTPALIFGADPKSPQVVITLDDLNNIKKML